MKYLVSAISINMLSRSGGSLDWTEVSRETAAQIASGAIPAIGHADTAAVVASDLGLAAAPYARTNIALVAGDELLVAQYIGPRLPEGVTTLPQGAEIAYFTVGIR